MKNLIRTIIISGAMLFAQNGITQDLEVDGNIIGNQDLNVGGGHITFINDISMPSPKVVSLINSLGEFEIKTLGTPGSSLTVQRDGGLNFDVGSINALAINANGTTALGTTSFDSQARLFVAQGSNQRGIFIEHSSGEFYTVDVDGIGDYNWRHRNETNLFGGAYIDSDMGYSFANFSDKSLKKDISSINSVLKNVLDLNVVQYRFKGDKSSQRTKTIGFIAQEVEKHFPEIVGEKDGYKTLAYSNFGILAIKAIQEQQQLIEQLEKRIVQLEK